MRIRIAFVVLGLCVLPVAPLVACGGEERPAAGAPSAPAAPAAEPTGGAAPGAEAMETASQIFGTRCTTCHGARGAGDGPASAGLTPKPRNLQDPDWQTSVSDEHIEKIILYGGAAVGRSPAMPANPDLMSKPEVVAALRQHIRDLAP